MNVEIDPHAGITARRRDSVNRPASPRPNQAARRYDPAMLDSPIRLSGDAISDETQLDGKRHLTLQLVDPLDDWLVTLHLILDLEGGRHEAELELEHGDDAVWSGVLHGEAVVDSQTEDADLDGGLRCEAIFRGEDGDRVSLALLESDPGAFEAVCGPGETAGESSPPDG
jgi:hypothetical protein